VFAAGSLAADRTDLTGRWGCDDGGHYFVRHVGNEVWWSGSSRNPKGPAKANFANIFHGTINGNVITESWVNDPKGEARNAGKLTLEIINNGKRLELKKTKETGGFSGGSWKPLK
jgi:hypothetical protein